MAKFRAVLAEIESAIKCVVKQDLQQGATGVAYVAVDEDGEVTTDRVFEETELPQAYDDEHRHGVRVVWTVSGRREPDPLPDGYEIDVAEEMNEVSETLNACESCRASGEFALGTTERRLHAGDYNAFHSCMDGWLCDDCAVAHDRHHDEGERCGDCPDFVEEDEDESDAGEAAEQE